MPAAKRILVTGGAGFIASHIADAYIVAGHEVTVVDNLSTGDRTNLNPKAHFVEGDLRNLDVTALIRDRNIQIVNHQAAQVDVRKSVEDPAADAEVNIVASVRLIKAAVDTGVEKFIFASSGGAAYGEPVEYPQTENHPVAPMSPYGCAKASVEHYLRSFQLTHGLHYVALRYANVYGTRQSTRGEAGVIAIFVSRLLTGQPVIINGDGLQTRDYVFVEDVVRANVAATFQSLVGPFNVGTGIETSVNHLAEQLRHLTTPDAKFEHGPAKKGEQKRSVLDGGLLRRAANLPEPVHLDQGLRFTVEWFRTRAPSA